MQESPLKKKEGGLPFDTYHVAVPQPPSYRLSHYKQRETETERVCVCDTLSTYTQRTHTPCPLLTFPISILIFILPGKRKEGRRKPGTRSPPISQYGIDERLTNALVPCTYLQISKLTIPAKKPQSRSHTHCETYPKQLNDIDTRDG